MTSRLRPYTPRKKMSRNGSSRYESWENTRNSRATMYPHTEPRRFSSVTPRAKSYTLTPLIWQYKAEINSASLTLRPWPDLTGGGGGTFLCKFNGPTGVKRESTARFARARGCNTTKDIANTPLSSIASHVKRTDANARRDVPNTQFPRRNCSIEREFPQDTPRALQPAPTPSRARFLQIFLRDADSPTGFGRFLIKIYEARSLLRSGAFNSQALITLVTVNLH